MMTVYFLETPYNNYGWNLVFLELIFYLKEKYNAKIVHSYGGHQHIDFLNLDQWDCELIIHDEDNDLVKAISFADTPMYLTDRMLERNKVGDMILISQFYNRFPRDFDKSTLNLKIVQGVFYTFLASTNNDYYYYYRKLHKETDGLIDKMFFQGRDRGDELKLREMGLCSPKMSTDHVRYMEEAIKYKIGLSIASVGEICYRDMEYLSIGLPMLRMEFMTQMNPPLIPNFHYIAIDRSDFPWSLQLDRDGDPENKHLDAYVKRFNEVKDDKEFLEFIAKNGRDYYERFASPQNRLNHLLKIMEL